jgi:predicted nuclease of restriction endonuclease-like (RecB) superfamily
MSAKKKSDLPRAGERRLHKRAGLNARSTVKSTKIQRKQPTPSAAASAPDDHAFAEIVEMIQAARSKALAAVNTALVDLYWRVGEYISGKLDTAAWGEAVVDELARYIQRRQPNLTGFTRRNLFRMRQFFEAYRGQKKVSPLVTQLPWTHHLIILGQSKRPEEREFYLRLAIRERWGKRELERQLRTAAFERAVLAPTKVSPVVAQTHPKALVAFEDSYMVEFLELRREHSEADLHRGLVNRLKDFPRRVGPRLLLRRVRIPPTGRQARLRARPIVFSSGAQLSLCH